MNFKRIFRIFINVAFLIFVLGSTVSFAAVKDIRNCPQIALMPFNNKAIVSQELNSDGMLDVASEYLTTQLVWCGRFDPIDYGQVNAALKMLQAGQTGLYDNSTVADVGKFIGAQFMMIGSVTGLTIKESGASVGKSMAGGVGFNKYTVTANVTLRAVDVETLKIVAVGMGTDSSSSSNAEFKVPLYRDKEINPNVTIAEILTGRRQNEKNFGIKIGAAKVSDIQVVNAINKAAWKALYSKTGLITFLDGGKVMKKPPPKAV